jgi:hypothetical protein
MSKKLFVLTMAVVLVAIACSPTSGGPSDPTPVIAATPAPTPSSTPKPGSPNNETVSSVTLMDADGPVTAAEVYQEVPGFPAKLLQTSTADGRIFVNGLKETDVIQITSPGHLTNRRMVGQTDPGTTYMLRKYVGDPRLTCLLLGRGKIATILPMDRVSVSVVGADGDQAASISKYIGEFAAVTGIDIAIRQPVPGETALTVTVTENVAGSGDLDGLGKPDIVQAGRVMAAHVDIKSAGILYGKSALQHEVMHALFGFVDLYPYGVGGDTSIMGGPTNVDQTLTDWDLAVLAQIRSRPPGTMWEDTLPGVPSNGATCN